MPENFAFLISRHYLIKLLIMLRMIWVSPYLFLLLILFDLSWSSNNFLHSGLVFSRNAPAYLIDSIILRAQANLVAFYTDYHLIYITTIVLVLSSDCPSTKEWIKMMWSMYTVALGLRGKAGGCARVTAGPKRPHLDVCSGPNIPLQGRQGSRGCIPGSPGESGLVSR